MATPLGTWGNPLMTLDRHRSENSAAKVHQAGPRGHVVTVKSGSDPRGTPNADGSGVRGAESNTGVVFGRGARGGMSMDARIRLRVDKHAGGP